MHRSEVIGYKFKNTDSIPGRCRNYTLHHHVSTSYDMHQASYQMGTSSPFLGVKQPLIHPVSMHRAIPPSILHPLLACCFGTKTIRPDFYSLQEPNCFSIFIINFVLDYASIFVFIVKNLLQHASSLWSGDVSPLSNPQVGE
jgi:hypothetical protein